MSMNTHLTLAVNDLLIHCGGGGNAGVAPKVMHSTWVAGAAESKFWWKNTPAEAVWRGKTLESNGKQTLQPPAPKRKTAPWRAPFNYQILLGGLLGKSSLKTRVGWGPAVRL